MNTNELAPLIAAAPITAGKPLRVVCLDDGCVFDAKLTCTKIDANGTLVTAERVAHATQRRSAPARELQEQVYNHPEHHDYWKSSYPTFDDFYNFMETARLAELRLVDEAVDVAVIHAEYIHM